MTEEQNDDNKRDEKGEEECREVTKSRVEEEKNTKREYKVDRCRKQESKMGRRGEEGEMNSVGGKMVDESREEKRRGDQRYEEQTRGKMEEGK